VHRFEGKRFEDQHFQRALHELAVIGIGFGQANLL
jgi:hypothetical protein